MLKILERGRRIHFTYFLGATFSLLLVCWQQLGKLVTSLTLTKCWHSYIKWLLKKSQIFKADVMLHCGLVGISWHETYLAYGTFTCATRKIYVAKSSRLKLWKNDNVIWEIVITMRYYHRVFKLLQFTNETSIYQPAQLSGHSFIHWKICHPKNQLKGLNGSWA